MCKPIWEGATNTLTIRRGRVFLLNDDSTHCQGNCFPCSWMDLHREVLTNIEVGGFKDKGRRNCNAKNGTCRRQ